MTPVALSRKDAAAALGISLDLFEERVQHEVRTVRLGRRVIVPVAELERWVDERAERALDGAM